MVLIATFPGHRILARPMRPSLRDLLIVVPLAAFGVAALVVVGGFSGFVVGGVFLLGAAVAFWYLTTHQGPATKTREEQAQARLRMSGNWPGGSGGGGGAY
jgi:hypothetical protein